MSGQENYQLFSSDICGFCARVRHFLQQRSIDMVVRDTLRDPAAFKELLQGGGRGTVPCLRIERGGEVEWMYESMDIISYLDAQSAHLEQGLS